MAAVQMARDRFVWRPTYHPERGPSSGVGLCSVGRTVARSNGTSIRIAIMRQL